MGNGKSALADLLGWHVIRVTASQIADGSAVAAIARRLSAAAEVSDG